MDKGKCRNSHKIAFIERDLQEFKGEGDLLEKEVDTDVFNQLLESNFGAEPQFVLMSQTTSTEASKLNIHGSKRRSKMSSTSIYSYFDPEHLEETKSPFRGIFYLHWLCMIAVILSTILRNYRLHGYFLGPNLWHIITRDIYVFLWAEIAMLSSLFVAPFIQKLFVSNWINIRWAFFLRHLFQFVAISSSVSVIYFRNWPYVQAVVLVLHTIAMYMKVHSYLSVNELLHLKWKQPSVQFVLLDDCLLNDGELQYPFNVTYSNFFLYLLIPSFLYHLNFPRTQSIRWTRVIEKTFSAFASFLLMYIVVEHWINPVLFESENMTFFEAFTELLFPFTVFYITGFYLSFECICNWFAEITCYANRSFYDDWWNSTTFDQFARKWNKPVHEFLFHHVYETLIFSYGLSKTMASTATFLFSSLLHEFVLAVICRRINYIFFMLQMCQVPLIYIGKLPFVKRHPLFSNLFFWSSMILGPPLLSLLYCRDYFLHQNWREDFAL